MEMIALSGGSGLSLVEQIVGQMKRLVDENVMRHGSRVTSIRTFARAHGVSAYTVAEAYERLVAESYFQSRPRSGYFVMKPRGDGKDAAGGNDASPQEQGAFPALRYVDTCSGTIPASSDLLPAEWQDSDQIKSTLRSIAIRTEPVAFQNDAPYGYRPLCDLIQTKMYRTGIHAGTEQILLTDGASHAVDLLIRGFLRSGDRVFVEDPAHFNLFNNLHLQGIETISIPRLIDGPDLDRVELLAKEHKPAMMFIQSMLHDPTGSCITPANAHRLLRLAEQYGFQIVENDSSSDMLDEHLPRIATLDQLNRVFYVGSFLSPLSLGPRVGFVAGPSRSIQVLCRHKMAMGVTGSQIDQRIVHLYLTEGHHRRNTERLRERLSRAARMTCAMLEERGFDLFCRPYAGKFIWTRAPWIEDSELISELAAAENIAIAPGKLFRSGGDPTPWFRLNVAYCAVPEVARFLSSLKHLPAR